MDWSAPHIGFVLASYGFSALVLGGLIVALLVQNRSAKQKLSAQPPDPATNNPRINHG